MISLKFRSILLGLIIPLLLGISWEIVTRFHFVPEQLLVPPAQVVETFKEVLQDGSLLSNIQISLKRVLVGFSIGMGSGILFGILLGISRKCELFFGPLFHALRQVPLFGWMPFLILVFGIEEPFKSIFVGISAFYPGVLNTFEGVRNVPKEYLDVARVFEYGRGKILWRVIFPAALPSIFAGLRVGLSTAWMFVVGAELIASSSGIGYLMTQGRLMFRYDVVLLGVFVIGVIGFVMNCGVGCAENYFLRWRRTFIAR